MTDNVIRREITPMIYEGRCLLRAHVWTDLGYSSKTFTSVQEASVWVRKARQAERRKSRQKIRQITRDR